MGDGKSLFERLEACGLVLAEQKSALFAGNLRCAIVPVYHEWLIPPREIPAVRTLLIAIQNVAP